VAVGGIFENLLKKQVCVNWGSFMKLIYTSNLHVRYMLVYYFVSFILRILTLCSGAWDGVVVHCATSRRVPGSIPGHWGFFLGHQTVPCALGSTQPLKMSTRIFLGVKTASL
jgi:hypothetical protein